MQLSRKSDYALRAIIFLATRGEGEISGLQEIAATARVSRPFLAKILNTLVRNGFVQSFRGVHGGFTLAKPPEQISFYEVIEAVDGPPNVNLCLSGEECEIFKTCLMVPAWAHIQREIEQVLRSKTVADVVAGRILPPHELPRSTV
jgi:Rrf2 family protein